MIVDKEEPVAAPGDITRYRTVDGFNLYLLTPAVGRYVFDRDAAVFVQRGGHIAHRRFNQMFTGLNAPKPCQRGNQPDGAVTAHVQKAAVVKEDDSRRGLWRNWLTEQCTDQNVVTARLKNNGFTPVVVVAGKTLPTLAHVPRSQIRKAVDDQASGFTAGVRINHSQFTVLCCHRISGKLIFCC